MKIVIRAKHWPYWLGLISTDSKGYGYLEVSSLW